MGLDRVVIALDDMKHRHDWLEQQLRPIGLELRRCFTVAAFRKAIAEHAPALILLDFDLGPDSMTAPDVNGETGRNAAKAIPDNFASPVIVWSLQRHRAEEMVGDLKSRGVRAQRCAFAADNMWKLAKAIIEEVSRG